jgi:hypothetical protein
MNPPPYPMPAQLRDETNAALAALDTEPALDSETRFVIRRLIAEAYARGFADGRIDQQINEHADRP